MMSAPERRLSPDVVAALGYWPDYVGGRQRRGTLSALVSFFNELLAELPWWNPAWRVVEVRPASPCFAATGYTRHTEVTVPGLVAGDGADSLPFSARVRFEGDRLIRFQAKVGDMVIGPAVAAAGAPEPDPFGAVLDRLIALRGVSERELALRSAMSAVTVRSMRHGWSPDPTLVARLAEALGMPAADLLAIARLEPDPRDISQ